MIACKKGRIALSPPKSRVEDESVSDLSSDFSEIVGERSVEMDREFLFPKNPFSVAKSDDDRFIFTDENSFKGLEVADSLEDDEEEVLEADKFIKSVSDIDIPSLSPIEKARLSASVSRSKSRLSSTSQKLDMISEMVDAPNSPSPTLNRSPTPISEINEKRDI